MTTAGEATTLPFDVFWGWLTMHPNCILRAGTPECVLYDDEDLHWVFANEATYLLVQVLKGKRLTGELLVEPEAVTYVEATTGDQEGEYVFELIAETENERLVTYFFVLVHGYEDEEEVSPHARVH